MNDAYQCPVPYVGDRIHAAAIYCSDGRVGDHFDDFLHHGLGLPRYDRVAFPGGPARLASQEEADLVLEELAFLVEAHELDRVVLIQHEGCAHYAQRLGVEGAAMEARQIADVEHATALIRKRLPIARVEAYFARREGSVVRFEAIAAV
jgi:hypothetical protein